MHKRVSYTALLGAVIATALGLVIGLGNPLGQAIGANPFTARERVGSTLVLSTTDAETANQVAAWADHFQQRLAGFLDVDAAPCVIKLFADRDSYVEYGEAYVPGFSPHMEFCYSRSHRSIYAYRDAGRKFDSRLAHEITHALIHSRMPELPLWLDEGVAELVESYRLAERELIFGQPQAGWMRMVSRRLDDDDTQPGVLPTIEPSEFYSRDGRIWYALSYATVLLLDREGRLPEAMAGSPIYLPKDGWRDFVDNPHTWSQTRERTDRAWLAGGADPDGDDGTAWIIPTRP